MKSPTPNHNRKADPFVLLFVLLALTIPVNSVILASKNLSVSLEGSIYSPAKYDVFAGRLNPRTASLKTNETAEVELSLSPESSVGDVEVAIFAPRRLVTVNATSSKTITLGDLKAGQITRVVFFVSPKLETDSYVAVLVKGQVGSRKIVSGYYLHVSPPDTMASSSVTDEFIRVMVVPFEEPKSPPSSGGSNSNSGYVTVRGSFLFMDTDNNLRPMIYTHVILYDYEPPNTYRIVAENFTDANGSYYFRVLNNDSSGGLDVRVGVRSETQGAATTRTSLGQIYEAVTSTQMDVPDGGVVDYGTLYPSSYNDAWVIAVYCKKQSLWILTRTSWARSVVDARWPYQSWPHSHGDSMHFPDRSAFNWDKWVVYHEYAHCVMYELYGYFPSGSGPDPHYIWSESSPGFAFVEGWSEFMTSAVENDPVAGYWSYGYYNGHGGNMETNDWYNCQDVGDMDGDIVEGSVASILWDIFDPINDDNLAYPSGTSSDGFDEIFDVMKQRKPNSINEFWTYFTSSYDHLYELYQVYLLYGINKDMTPPSTPTQSRPISGARVNPKPFLNWTAATDDLSGVANYTLEVDTSMSFNTGNLRRISGIAATNYTLTQNLSLGLWYWRVRARDRAGNNGSFSSSRTMICDRIRISSGGASDGRDDVGRNITIWYKVVYRYDNASLDSGKGIVQINGKNATWSAARQRWELNESRSSVQKVTYQVTAVQDTANGITGIDDLAGSRNAIWDRIILFGGGVSATFVNTGLTETIWLKAQYEYDLTQFNSTCGKIYLNGSQMTWFGSRSRWELNYTSNDPRKFTFLISSMIDNLYGLTAINDTFGQKSIIWTDLRLNPVNASPASVVNLDNNITLYAKVIWGHNNSVVVGAHVSLNSTLGTETSNGTGWVSFLLQPKVNVTRFTYVLEPLNDSTGQITRGISRTIAVAWTQLVVAQVQVDRRMANTGSPIEILAKITWAHNGSAAIGSQVGVNGSASTGFANASGWAKVAVTNDLPAEWAYRVKALRDAFGYVTNSTELTTLKLTWSELWVTSIWSNDSLLNIGESAHVKVQSRWAHNNSAIVNAIIAVDGTQSPTNQTGWASLNITRNLAGKYVLIAEVISDSLGLVTKCTMKKNVTVTWTALRIDVMTWNSDLVNAGDVIQVYAHLAFAHNSSSIAGGSISLNGTSALTNSTGWGNFTVQEITALSRIYVVKGVRDPSGEFNVSENEWAHAFTWTGLNISEILSNATMCAVNGTVRILARVVWAHNGSSISNALVELAGNSSSQQVRTNSSGYAIFNVTANVVGDYLYNATGREAQGITEGLKWRSLRVKFGTKRNMTLHLKQGYNLMSLPLLNESLTASSLLKLIGNASQSVFMYNATAGNYVSYDRKLVEFGIPQPDFEIEPNAGYFVYVESDKDFTLIGIDNVFRRNVHLKTGYNLLGWTYTENSNVTSAFIRFSAIDSVFAFNSTTQKYTSHDRKLAEFGIPQPDFAIVPGCGYFVFSNVECDLYYEAG